MNTLPIPIFTQFENRDSTLNKDAKLVNGYGEFDDVEIFAVKRPGVEVSVEYGVGTAQGIVTYLGVVRVIRGNVFFKTPTSSVSITAAASNHIDFI